MSCGCLEEVIRVLWECCGEVIMGCLKDFMGVPCEYNGGVLRVLWGTLEVSWRCLGET